MDSISNFLVSIKNAGMAGKPSISVPYSKMKMAIAEVLSEKGFIGKFKADKEMRKIDIEILYKGKKPRVSDVKRISKPSRRLYEKSKSIKPFMQKVGMRVLSTPVGVLSDLDAKKKKVGGEILFSIW